MTNPHPRIYYDDVANVQVPNESYRVWEEARRETLKEVGRWLNALSAELHSGAGSITKEDIATFLRGEMPGLPQADCHIEDVPKHLHT